MPSAPSGDRTARGGARAIRQRAHPETPPGIKLVAWLVALGSVADAAIGLATISTTGLGVLLLGVAVAELYLAYGLYHLQRWAYRGTIVVQVCLLPVLVLLGWVALVFLKVALVAYLLARRDAGWY